MCEHNWVRGKYGIHVEFPTKTQGKRQLRVLYLRCSKCNQDGFRKTNGSDVIYTWSKGYSQN
jgi:hypothetical protein